MGITLTEIRGQYSALKKTLEAIDAQYEKFARCILDFDPRSVLFIGCGSSFMVSRSLRSIAEASVRWPVHALAAGDLWLNTAQYAKMLEGALVVSLSRSGQTTELLRAIEAVKRLCTNARFVSVSCVEDSPLEALSDMTLCLPWAFDESVCQTRCVSNLYAAGAYLISKLTKDDATCAGFSRMAALGEGYLMRSMPLIERIAQKPWTRAVVLADGVIDGLAEEGALAFNEISQLPSNCYHLLDVRHGPMVLIGGETLVIAAVKSPKCEIEHNLLADIQRKNAMLVVYSNLPVEIEGADCFSVGEDVGQAAGGLGLLAICQLMSYFKSFHVGCDPDRPDGLTPWIKIG